MGLSQMHVRELYQFVTQLAKLTCSNQSQTIMNTGTTFVWTKLTCSNQSQTVMNTGTTCVWTKSTHFEIEKAQSGTMRIAFACTLV
jgi:hypothetical protein